MTTLKILNGDHIVEATPELIAEMFCGLDSEGQARFYNHIAKTASEWKYGDFEFQLTYITDEKCLDYGGRRVMQSIGEFSHWGLRYENSNHG